MASGPAIGAGPRPSQLPQWPLPARALAPARATLAPQPNSAQAAPAWQQPYCRRRVMAGAANQLDKLEKRYTSGLFARSAEEQEALRQQLAAEAAEAAASAVAPSPTPAPPPPAATSRPLLESEELLDNLDGIDAGPRYTYDAARHAPEIPGTRLITDPAELDAIGQGLPIVQGEEWPEVYWRALNALGKGEEVQVRATCGREWGTASLPVFVACIPATAATGRQLWNAIPRCLLLLLYTAFCQH